MNGVPVSTGGYATKKKWSSARTHARARTHTVLVVCKYDGKIDGKRIYKRANCNEQESYTPLHL